MERTPAQLQEIANAAQKLLETFDQEWYEDSDEEDYDYVGPLHRDSWLELKEALS